LEDGGHGSEVGLCSKQIVVYALQARIAEVIPAVVEIGNVSW
jgi:hypothetical protein